jgi:hypothetical protein
MMSLRKAKTATDRLKRAARTKPPLVGTEADRLRRLGLLGWSALTFLFACREISSNPDLPWHLEFGRRILAGRGVPTADTLTYTAAGRPYVDLHWLWQVACAWIDGWGGTPALVLANALAITVAVSLPFVSGGRRRAAGSLLPWAALLILLGMEIRFAVRPEVGSLLFLSAYLAILWFLSWSRPWTLWLLVPLQILWTNVQPLFAIGIVVTVLNAAGEVGDSWIRGRSARGFWRRRGRSLAAVIPAMLVGTLINPYGLHGVLFPLQLMNRVSGSSTIYREAISELLPTFHRAADAPATAIPLAIAMAIACLGWLLRVRRRHWLRGLLILLPLFYLALSAVRNVPYVLLAGLFLWVESARRETLSTRYPPLRRRSAAVLFLAVVLILAGTVATDRYYEALGRATRTGLRMSALSHPGPSVLRRVSSLPAGLRVFNGLDTAGFLASLPGREGTLFIDGRLEVMGEGVFGAYAEGMSGKAAFEAARARYGFRAALFSTRLGAGIRMAAILVESGNWVPAAVSPSTIVLVESSLMADLGWAPADPEELLGQMARERNPVVLRQAGRAAIGCGWPEAAVELLHRSLDRNPRDSGTAISLVEALLRAGQTVEARRIAEEGMRRFPRSYGAQEALAQVLIIEGDEDSIRGQLERMRHRFSREPHLWRFLARYYEQGGHALEAAEARSRARELER